MNQRELNLTGEPDRALKRRKVPCPNCEHEKAVHVCWFCMGKARGDFTVSFGAMSHNQQDDYLAGRKIGKFRYL